MSSSAKTLHFAFSLPLCLLLYPYRYVPRGRVLACESSSGVKGMIAVHLSSRRNHSSRRKTMAIPSVSLSAPPDVIITSERQFVRAPVSIMPQEVRSSVHILPQDLGTADRIMPQEFRLSMHILPQDLGTADRIMPLDTGAPDRLLPHEMRWRASDSHQDRRDTQLWR